jgi:hypothetical protein
MNADDISAIATGVTKKWAKQRKAEERDARARNRRVYMYSGRVCQSDVAARIIPKAYAKVSDNGRLPASQRQLYYACRDEFQKLTGRTLDYKYFAQVLLRKFLQRPETLHWKVTRDARGTLIEPHTSKHVPVGTLQIDDYLEKCGNPDDDLDLEFETDYPTAGPDNRYQALLYIEKEGFNELFKAVKLAERFDIAIMSCKGQSVIAARKLVDELCGASGIPLLILHDFDKYGFDICRCLTEVSWDAEEDGRVAYEFQNDINAIDIGLRLSDVEEWKLVPEFCSLPRNCSMPDNVTAEEEAYLRGGRRVELNAFTSPDFVKFVEEKLRGAGIEQKYIPDDDALLDAFRRANLIAKLNTIVEESRDEAESDADAMTLPKGLRSKIAKALKEKPEKPWDEVLYDIVRKEVDDDE